MQSPIQCFFFLQETEENEAEITTLPTEDIITTTPSDIDSDGSEASTELPSDSNNDSSTEQDSTENSETTNTSSDDNDATTDQEEESESSTEVVEEVTTIVPELVETTQVNLQFDFYGD